jgi:hypothetical protein
MIYSFYKLFLFFKRFNFHLFLILFLMSCSPDSENLTSSFDVSVSVKGNGTVSSSQFDVITNTIISITATPNEGYYFDRWQGTGEVNESETLDLLVNQAYVLTAVFLPFPTLDESVEVYNPKKIDSSPVFMIKSGGTQAFLTDKTGVNLQTFDFNSKLGNDLELLPDGNLIGLFKPETIFFSFGGYGGILRKLSPEGEIIWEYTVNTENELLHHDFEILPNGNILLMIWERFTASQSIALGYKGDGPIYLEKISELNPESFEIVWEWRSVDHLIQDHLESASNYGVVGDHPEKINLNYSIDQTGDLMHANGLFYDDSRNVIYLSVNFFSEVWVIPHSYSTDENKTDLADLSFRFGNPSTFNNDSKRFFYRNHHPTLTKYDPFTEGRFLIYMNGFEDSQSIVYEFILPDYFDSNPINWVMPEESWSFTDPDLFYAKISGAYRLPNGNTLICEGDYGYWEVTRSGEVVWKYNGGGPNFWRGYVYPNN